MFHSPPFLIKFFLVHACHHTHECYYFFSPHSIPWVLQKPAKSLSEVALWLQYVHAHCGKMMLAWGVNHRPLRCSQIYAGNTCSEGQITIFEDWIQKYIQQGERVINDKVFVFIFN